MGSQAAYLGDEDDLSCFSDMDPGELDDQYPGDGDEDDEPHKVPAETFSLSDIQENTNCSWCGGPLPDGRYVFCGESCRSAAGRAMWEDLGDVE